MLVRFLCALDSSSSPVPRAKDDTRAGSALSMASSSPSVIPMTIDDAEGRPSYRPASQLTAHQLGTEADALLGPSDVSDEVAIEQAEALKLLLRQVLHSGFALFCVCRQFDDHSIVCTAAA